ncbi:hypothetical protein GUJ93_ZPchr0458g22739 [Zizania palustris]|uniref:Uncharacterized protein n=1 Tax=Zizania palustris TaxID=103762 RepID=A0A8J5RED7_ZIZPA|nr:hypothetical protein GUJ93_ZPchr0458g22739 [Zizania palustris]
MEGSGSAARKRSRTDTANGGAARGKRSRGTVVENPPKIPSPVMERTEAKGKTPVEDVMGSSILCDSKLQELFGCENIPVSELSDLLAHHFTKQTSRIAENSDSRVICISLHESFISSCTRSGELHPWLHPSSISPKINSILHSHIYQQVGHVVRALAKLRSFLLDVVSRKSSATTTRGGGKKYAIGYSSRPANSGKTISKVRSPAS